MSKRTIRRLLPAMLLCAAPVSGSASVDAAAGMESFNHAVAVCRFFHGGRASQRENLRLDQPAMQTCLRQRGWWSDGTRTLTRPAGVER